MSKTQPKPKHYEVLRRLAAPSLEARMKLLKLRMKLSSFRRSSKVTRCYEIHDQKTGYDS